MARHKPELQFVDDIIPCSVLSPASWHFYCNHVKLISQCLFLYQWFIKKMMRSKKEKEKKVKEKQKHKSFARLESNSGRGGESAES